MSMKYVRLRLKPMFDLIEDQRATVSLGAPRVSVYHAKKRDRYWTERDVLSRPTVVLQNLSCTECKHVFRRAA